MLLRTLLLLLCASSGLCATLGLFQMQEKEEDTAVLDQDTEAAKVHVEEGLLEKLFANDIQAEAGKDKSPDSAPSEEGVDSDKHLEEIPKVETTEAPVTDQPSQEIPTEAPVDDQSSQEIPKETPVDDQPSQEIPKAAPVDDQPSLEIPKAAPVDDQPSQEDNEIRPVQTEEVPKQAEESSSWSLNSIRSSFQNMNGYFDSLVELVGGRNGVCEYRCRYGDPPAPRPGYQLPEPNGCSSSLVGFQLDLGIPAMTQCCNQLDSCYDTCGTSKYDCDSTFRSCLHDICSDLKRSLGLGTQVQTCESMADGLFNTVWTLGCRPYMNSQRAACICHGEEKDEL